MIVEQSITNDDRIKLENMLSFQYAMLYHPFHNRRKAHKVIYIMTPILLLLSIGCYFVHSYVMFGIGIAVTLISSIWIIWYRLIGVKFEKKVHDTIYQSTLKAREITINEEGIFIDKLYEYTEIGKVFLYDEFFLLITKDKKLIIIKADNIKKEEIKKHLNAIKNIEVVVKDKPFNIYQYLKRS